MNARADSRQRSSSSALSDLTFRQIVALTILAVAPGVFTIATVIPSRAIRHYSLPIVIAEACLIACCLGGPSISQALRRARRSRLAAALGLVSVSILATALVATERTTALLHLGMTIIELAFGFCLWGAFSSNWAGFQRRFLIALAVGISYHVVLAYCIILSVRNGSEAGWVYFHAGTSNVRHLGYYGTALCGLGAGLLATADTALRRACFLALATIGFAWNDLSGGRAAFGAGVAGCALVWVLAPTSRKRMLAVELLTAFVAAMPLSAIYIPTDSWGIWRIFNSVSSPEDYRTEGRLTLWQQAIKGIVGSPWIGHGEDQFVREKGFGLWNHPHDSVLQLLYQWGVLGTGCVLAIVGPIIAGCRQSASLSPALALPALGALVGLLLMSLLDGPLYYPFPLMVVIICLAVLASIQRSGAGRPRACATEI